MATSITTPLRSRLKNIISFVISALCAIAIMAGTTRAADVTLAWDANEETDLVGYYLYYYNIDASDRWISEAGESPIRISIDTLPDPDQPVYNLAGLTAGVTYLFVITAFNDVDESPLPDDEDLYQELENPNVASSDCVHVYTVPYTISVDSNEPGVSFQLGDVEVQGGTAYTVDVTPDPSLHVHVVDVIVNGESRGALPTVTLDSVEQDYEIQVIFEKDSYLIETIAGENGIIEPGGAISFEHGSSQTFIMTSDEGYEVLDVIVDNVSIGAVTEYPFENITEPHTIEARFVASAPPFSFEANEISVDHNWRWVSFKNTYVDPVVVAGSFSLNDSHPGVVRINNVTPNGFDISIQEWDYLDDQHAYESVGYVVMESGAHTLPDGTLVKAGNFETNATSSFKTVQFNGAFNTTPVVIAAPTTFNEPDAITIRISGIHTQGFSMKFQEQEANTQDHDTETVSYIAWEPSQGSVNGIVFEVDSTPAEVRDEDYRLFFKQFFAGSPSFISAMQSCYGGDTTSVRWLNKTGSSLYLKLAEEQSISEETDHTDESVGYMLFLP